MSHMLISTKCQVMRGPNLALRFIKESFKKYLTNILKFSFMIYKKMANNAIVLCLYDIDYVSMFLCQQRYACDMIDICLRYT